MVCASGQPLTRRTQHPRLNKVEHGDFLPALLGFTNGLSIDSSHHLTSGLRDEPVVGPTDWDVKLGCSAPTLPWTPATTVSDIGTACPAPLSAQGGPCCLEETRATSWGQAMGPHTKAPEGGHRGQAAGFL